jgi:hypothetical protein
MEGRGIRSLLVFRKWYAKVEKDGLLLGETEFWTPCNGFIPSIHSALLATLLSPLSRPTRHSTHRVETL